MRSLITYINEGFKIGKTKGKLYTYQPKDKNELKEILYDLLKEDTNTNLNDINDIDVSEITDMSRLFVGLDPHNIDISEWDVSNVKDMSEMFRNCKNYNGNGLENWDVSNVENMSLMFAGCTHFNDNLSKWDVSKCNNMRYMFYHCSNFEGKGLENWNVSKVTYMESMFDSCKKFNCDLSKWNVKKVANMSSMFYECSNFEGKGLENWNIMNVCSSDRMFYGCCKLDVDLSSWPEPINISEYYDKMFTGCTLMKKTGSKRVPKWWSWVYNS